MSLTGNYAAVPIKQDLSDQALQAVKIQDQTLTTTTTSTVQYQDHTYIAPIQQQVPVAMAVTRPLTVADDELAKGGGGINGTGAAGVQRSNQPLTQVPMARLIDRPKLEIFDAYVLHLALGMFGALHFRMGRPALGLIYLFTFGGFGLGYVVDLFRIIPLVMEYNSKQGRLNGNESNAVLIGDCYALWILDIFGVAQFYMKRNGWGLFYLFSGGGFGMGILADLIRFPYIVQEYNLYKTSSEVAKKQEKFSLGDAYILLVPFGLFGAHHFYLRDYKTGFLYFFTVGLFGLGFLADFVRLPRYVHEANQRLSLNDLNAPIAEASAV
jgi:TM2 domain-containing membrane protein YozV